MYFKIRVFVYFCSSKTAYDLPVQHRVLSLLRSLLQEQVFISELSRNKKGGSLVLLSLYFFHLVYSVSEDKERILGGENS